MANKTYKELWDELVPVYGEAKTAQGEMVRSIGRLYREHNEHNYSNYDSDKYDYNIQVIEGLASNEHLPEDLEDVDEMVVALTVIVSSGLFELDDKELEKHKKAYDECSRFDAHVGYLKKMLPEHADLIKNLRSEVPLGAFNEMSAYILKKLYVETLDIAQSDYRKYEDLLQEAKERFYDEELEKLLDEQGGSNIDVSLGDMNSEVSTLVEKLKPLIAHCPFPLLNETNLDSDLDSVEKIVTEYCNSHPELVDLELCD